MAVGADHAGDHVADRHAVAHLRERAVVVLAEHFQRAVLVLRRLRRQFDAPPPPCTSMLLPRRVAERAPRRHAAAFADAIVRIEPGRDREFARTLFKFVGRSHAVLLAARI